MLPDHLKKVKSWTEHNASDLFASAVIFLTGVGGFGLGRLSVLWQDALPLEIIEPAPAPAEQNRAQNLIKEGTRPAMPSDKTVGRERGMYVGSRSGSSYHAPWCPGAQKIKEANKVWFADTADARAHGYKPAANCPGIE